MPDLHDDAASRAGAVLAIDLAALAANYGRLREAAAPATCACVVKADAYGLGVARVAPVLAQEGCRDFFVAHLDEGIALRAILGAAPRIAILHGLVSGTERDARDHDLLPVLNDDEQRDAWRRLAAGTGRTLPAILQVDTGMARFGFAVGDLPRRLDDPEAFRGIELRLLMSHLACADEADHPANARQLRAFAAARRHLPGVPSSLAASAGIFLGAAYHADMVRPGAALYGVNPRPGSTNPMRPVVRLRARVMQLRDVPAGTPVGYGHRAATERATRLATLAIGYADGLLRSTSGHGAAWHGAIRLPMMGRVSMDSVVVDVGAAEALAPGDLVDVIGPHHDVDAAAAAAGTIGYEVLTSLGARFHRSYIGVPPCT